MAIGKRVGHSGEKITYRYAHLFPSKQDEMADRLDMERKEEGEKEDVSEIIGPAGKMEK